MAHGPIEELGLEVANYSGVLDDSRLARALLWVAFQPLLNKGDGEDDSEPRGVYVGRTYLDEGVPVSEVLGATQSVIDDFGAPDLAGLQELVNDPDFIHPDDIEDVTAHIAHDSSQPYHARFLKYQSLGNPPASYQYAHCHVRGVTVPDRVVGEKYRLTILWPVED